MICEVSLEMGHRHFGPKFLDRVLCFCLGGGNFNPPPIASLNQCTVENQTSSFAVEGDDLRAARSSIHHGKFRTCATLPCQGAVRLGPVRKLLNRLLIELDVGLQPYFH